jgi:long-chain acyl-CoA synthetase
MPHVYEHLGYWISVANGFKLGIYGGDVKKLKFDMQALSPTIFPSVPRLLNRIFDSISGTMNGMTGMSGWIARRGIKQKLANYKKSGKTGNWFYDSLVFKKVREKMGGKVQFITSGSAPINPETLNFLRIAFSAQVQEGYGQTESCGLTSVTDPMDTTAGHVGGVAPS